jgi:hypothetical protein
MGDMTITYASNAFCISESFSVAMWANEQTREFTFFKVIHQLIEEYQNGKFKSMVSESKRTN